MDVELIKLILSVFCYTFVLVAALIAFIKTGKMPITPYDAAKLLEKRATKYANKLNKYEDKLAKKCPYKKEVLPDEEKKDDA